MTCLMLSHSNPVNCKPFGSCKQSWLKYSRCASMVISTTKLTWTDQQIRQRGNLYLLFIKLDLSQKCVLRHQNDEVFAEESADQTSIGSSQQTSVEQSVRFEKTHYDFELRNWSQNLYEWQPLQQWGSAQRTGQLCRFQKCQLVLQPVSHWHRGFKGIHHSIS